MLSLWRPGLIVLSCVDFVKWIQDPRHLFKVKRPESHMVEVVIYVSSNLLTTCSPLVQLDRCKALHFYFNQCTEKKKLGHNSVLLDRGEKKNTVARSLSQADNCPGSYYVSSCFLSFFMEILPDG